MPNKNEDIRPISAEDQQLAIALAYLERYGKTLKGKSQLLPILLLLLLQPVKAIKEAINSRKKANDEEDKDMHKLEKLVLIKLAVSDKEREFRKDRYSAL